eukprot:1151098-Pelagomonas_calceolata.AAC.4
MCSSSTLGTMIFLGTHAPGAAGLSINARLHQFKLECSSQAPEITAELFVEVLGCLANLYLPEFDFFTLVRKHDLLHFLATYAQPGAGVEVSIKMEINNLAAGLLFLAFRQVTGSRRGECICPQLLDLLYDVSVFTIGLQISVGGQRTLAPQGQGPVKLHEGFTRAWLLPIPFAPAVQLKQSLAPIRSGPKTLDYQQQQQQQQQQQHKSGSAERQ